MSKPKPTIVFLDTDQFCAKRLFFAHSDFLRLADLVENGLAKVLLTEIVDREVRRHIHKDLHEARSKLEKAIGGGLFQNLKEGPPLHEVYWDKAESEITEKFRTCCNRMKAEILPVKPEFASKVFDWYFADDAPFDTSKRKAEFPDAFSLACVCDWATKRGERVYVISKDEAFRRIPKGAEQSTMLTWLDSLAAYLALFPDPKLAESIKAAFVEFLEDDRNSSFGEGEFQELFFYVEDSENLEVKKVTVFYTKPDRLYVVEAADGRAVLTGSLFVDFFAEIDGIREEKQSSTLIDAEIALKYDVQHPHQIDVQSIKYDQKWGIGVRLPSSYRPT